MHGGCPVHEAVSAFSSRSQLPRMESIFRAKVEINGDVYFQSARKLRTGQLDRPIEQTYQQHDCLSSHIVGTMRALSTSRLAAKAIQRPGPAVVPACQLLSSSSRSLAPKPPTSLAYSPLESEEFKAAYTQTREKWEPTAEASEAAGGPSARPHYSQRPRAPRTPRFAQQQSTAPATRSSDPRFNSDGQPRGSRSSDPRPSHNGQPRAPKFPRPETTPLEHLLTLADLTPSQIDGMVRYAMAAKWIFYNRSLLNFPDTLAGRSIAMIFAKRSTRTRVSAESAIHLLGGNPMFLGKDDIQLGVNESMRDSATVIGSMSDGILARVNAHEDVEMLARYSPVPVINALSDLYHPLQILADLQTMVENIRMPPLRSLKSEVGNPEYGTIAMMSSAIGPRSRLFSVLAGKKFAWVGDTNNITNELMVTLPRFGAQMVVASPKGYDQVDPRVMAVLCVKNVCAGFG